MPLSISKKVRNALKRGSFSAFFLLDRLGVHVLPKHYYTPVPDYSWLHHNRELWQGRAKLVGVEWDLKDQLDWLQEICQPYYHEVEGLGTYREVENSGLGQGYGPLESQVLHCFIRSVCPATVVEIGSGASTKFLLHAANRNDQENRTKPKIIAVEPFPKPAFQQLTEEVVHIEEACQKVPQSVFSQLAAGDLLFIDSSHSVKVGSDVLHIYLNIIPQLKPGVFVHIHDIFLPYLYHRTLFSDYFGWQETSLLLALLTNNKRLRVLCCQSALHYDRSKEMSEILRDYRPQANFEGLVKGDRLKKHFPNSLWLQTS